MDRLSGEHVDQIILKTRNEKMKLALERAMKASESDASILIIGESGVGKELFSRYIHWKSKRRDKPFVAVNCPALTETLLESELFGHERGAFTGAIRDKRGKFELADEGTIFLDEIGDMSISAQAKLLRVIEYHEFERVGGEKPIRVNTRVVSATNKNMVELIKQGKFRQDLYYRINEITIEVPALRERKEDIPLLAEAFLAEFNQQTGKNLKRLSEAALKVLMSYDWPGNIRELKSVIRRAVTLADNNREALWIEDLGTHISFLEPQNTRTDEDLSLDAMEKRHIERVLKLTGYNKSRTAELLKISRPTLDKKIQNYRIEMPENP